MSLFVNAVVFSKYAVQLYKVCPIPCALLFN